MKPSMKLLALNALAALIAICSANSAVVFDNMSNFESGNPNAHISSTGSTPNTFMGAGYNLVSGTTAITGFDLFPVNLSGTSFTGLRINLFVWGSVNLGTVNATTPAFGNLLGSYTFDSTGTFSTGFYFPFESATPGVTPGVTLATPLTIPGTTIGLSFNYQGTTDGVNYTSINSLTSLISYGTPPNVGSTVFSGYYRNANSENNGNFTSTLRTLGQVNEGLGVRVYGLVVPEPTSIALAGLGAAALLIFRRRK
jgi:hypothetical protein